MDRKRGLFSPGFNLPIFQTKDLSSITYSASSACINDSGIVLLTWTSFKGTEEIFSNSIIIDIS